MKSKSFFLEITGNNKRMIELEAIQTYYTMTKDPTPTSKKVSEKDLEWLLSKSPSDFDFRTMSWMFGKLANTENRDLNGVPHFEVDDTFTGMVESDSGKIKVDTTVGRYVFNKVLYELSETRNLVPYVNEQLNEKKFNKIEGQIARALLEDRTNIDTFVKYIDIRDWLGLQMHAVVTTSFSPNTIKINPEVKKLKDKLVAEHKEELEAGDPRASEKIEKALVAKTEEVLKGDYGMDLYLSGARGSVDNNMKNNLMYRGSVLNASTGKYEIITTSLMEGLQKKDFPASSNTIVNGAYPKSVQTSVSGYLAKEILAALQTEVLDEPGSDCGTKGYLVHTITPNKKNDFLYRYVIEGSKLVCLTPEVIDKYVGKPVKLRSPMYCIGKKICNHCAGEMFYKLGIRNAGLTSSKVATKLTNLNMNFIVFLHRNVYLKTSLIAGNSR